jgi:hypothetical protein
MSRLKMRLLHSGGPPVKAELRWANFSFLLEEECSTSPALRLWEDDAVWDALRVGAADTD